MSRAATIRPFDPPADYRTAAALISTTHAHDGIDWLPTTEVIAHEWRAVAGFDPATAFRDHFEPSVRTEEDFVGWFAAPSLDTSLWQVAWDADEVAASIMTSINAEENAKIGLSLAWLDWVAREGRLPV